MLLDVPEQIIKATRRKTIIITRNYTTNTTICHNNNKNVSLVCSSRHSRQKPVGQFQDNPSDHTVGCGILEQF